MFIMAGVNEVQNCALIQMRKDILTSKKHIQHYKKLYKDECLNSKNMLKKLLNMQKTNERLVLEIEKLKAFCKSRKEVKVRKV